MSSTSFRAVRGLEENILSADYIDGYVYFATDTKKIYIDTPTEAKVMMGGNSGIYYGKMKMAEEPPENQVEFEFTVMDIEGNDESDHYVIPNVDDLILNIDGCFYRVVELLNEGLDTIIITHKLTLAGGGGSGSGSASDLGVFKITNTTPKTITILADQPYSIGANLEASDYNGDVIDGGIYKLAVGGIEKKTGTVVQGDNLIPVGDLLSLGENKLRLKISVDRGGEDLETKSLNYTITTTEMNITWNYKNTKINSTDEDFELDYEVSGVGISKDVTLVIDDIYIVPLKQGLTSTSQQTFILTPTDLLKYNVTHGVHKFELKASTNLNGSDVQATPVIRNVIFAEPGNNSPIISYELFNKNLVQYNTITIPVIIYSADNIAGNAIVILREGGEEVDRWEGVVNGVENTWSYTPTISGPRLLTIQCGNSEVSFTVEVEALDIDIEEVENYVYRFKASDFASNSAVQNWNSNNVTATFSPEFDWVNGGLRSEKDEDGYNRQYLCIKAGSTMTINHKLFEKNAKSGKNLKLIFQAANCRDYDGQVLECKVDTKIVNVNSEVEKYLMDIQNGDTLTHGETIIIDNAGHYVLSKPEESVLDLTSTDSRAALKERFIERYESVEIEAKEFEANKYFILIGDEYIIATEFDEAAEYYLQKFYQIHFGEVEAEEETEEKTYYLFFYEASIKDHFEGFVAKAQYATLNSSGSTLTTQYCEDTYIELEFDIAEQDEDNNINPKNYIKYWIDGVPCGYAIYSGNDSFMAAADQYITIGSPDCDVYLYMIKLYNKSLSDTDHLNNFIMDAPNATEMMSRFKRNDIMDDNRKTEISPTKLAKANPGCLVHVYTTTQEGMPITKKTKRKGCEYRQYHNSDTAVLSATDVTIKVQGTSSEKYVVAAANIDADFTTGFKDADGNVSEGWSMDGGTAIPVNFFCTKVNVASCENANNALNQEWYNMFQPYQTVVRFKKPGARDTMQFTNGVMFVEDHNPNFDINASEKKLNNVFGEVTNYLTSPYPKLYSLANMGNSKDNVEVFHDATNPLECCVEVNDNQTAQQWMVNDNYNKADIGAGEDYFDFRYPDGVEEVQKMGEQGQAMIDNWNNFVSWMASSNPQPKYEKHNASNETEYLSFAFNPKTQAYLNTYYLRDGVEYVVTEYNSDITEYYTETPHVKGYTNLPLPDDAKKHFDPYVFKGYRCTEQVNDKGELWQKDYTPLIEGITESTYAGDYTHDTYEYRMAKMLEECEDHLVMDSVVYHYLFIERHCMIDNVAKNTFWSTEDGLRWNLTKDYDNDTADGNDNNGKFTRTYGMEIMDKLNENVYVFNAHQAAWLNFIHGLPTVREQMFQKIDELRVEYNGKLLKCWNAEDYLWFFKQWQKRIPERCWIEDYRRKYFRPYELYNDTMFNSMMEGGQKTHQRKQYETYQGIYMSSEYNGADALASYLTIRTNGKNMLNAPLAVEVYSDCYIRMDTGSDTSVQRVKRNELNFFRCPTNDLNNATMYFYPAKLFSIVGSVKPGEGMVGDYYPEQVSFNNASKLRELVVSTYDSDTANASLKTGFDLLGNPMLEVLYAANLSDYTSGLNLNNCINLRKVDARKSSFTNVEIANGAPVEIVKLQNPTSLSMSNTNYLKELSIDNYGRLTLLKLTNVDNENVSTLNLVNSAYALLNYRLNGVKWTLTSSSEVDANNKTIDILETLLTKKPLETKDGWEPLSTALTGSLTVTANAYNGTDSFDIYNKYVQDEVYPSLDISFEAESSKLYQMTILDGDYNVNWYRKLKSGDVIDADFLSDGPAGAFDPAALYKAPTADKTYTFTKTWLVKSSLDSEEVIATLTNSETPYYTPEGGISQDLVFVPVFNEEVRKYDLTFYMDDTLANPVIVKDVAYGTKLTDVNVGDMPYKEPPTDADNIAMVYDFLGYGLVANSTTPLHEDFTISGAQSFYPIFSDLVDVRTVIHPEWFEYRAATYSQDKSSAYENVPFDHLTDYDRQGYWIKPKGILRGKITIPAKYEDKLILGIEGFGSTDKLYDSNQKVTHIFFESDAEIRRVESGAFRNLKTLVYFDWSGGKIRMVEAEAFYNCPLHIQSNEIYQLSYNLFMVGSRAFSGAFSAPDNSITIQIPANTQVIGGDGFAYLRIPKGATLNIGDSGNPSRLNLAKPNASADNIYKFQQNSDNILGSINFYSGLYSSSDDAVGTYQVINCFTKNVGSFTTSLNVVKGGV